MGVRKFHQCSSQEEAATENLKEELLDQVSNQSHASSVSSAQLPSSSQAGTPMAQVIVQSLKTAEGLISPTDQGIEVVQPFRQQGEKAEDKKEDKEEDQ